MAEVPLRHRIGAAMQVSNQIEPRLA